MKEVFIAPSLLAANKNDFKGEINKVVSLGAKYIHFDVMDKKFIGHTSFSFKEFSQVASLHKQINDVHLMVIEPFTYAKEFAKLGADIITFHYEAFKENVSAIDCIEAIRQLGVKVGMSIKPKTPVDKIIPFLPLLDLVLIMSVEPGLGGQEFMPNALYKIEACRKFIDEHNLKCLIEVDGGINEETGYKCFKSGADILVAGSYLFGHDDIDIRYKNLITKCHD